MAGTKGKSAQSVITPFGVWQKNLVRVIISCKQNIKNDEFEKKFKNTIKCKPGYSFLLSLIVNQFYYIFNPARMYLMQHSISHRSVPSSCINQHQASFRCFCFWFDFIGTFRSTYSLLFSFDRYYSFTVNDVVNDTFDHP